MILKGATSGIGKGTAIEFASHGCKLVISGRNQEALKESRKLCLEASKGVLKEEHVLPIVADVAVDEDRVRLIKQTIDHFGQLDILINNAGIIVKGPIENASMDDYDRVMNVNTRAVYHLTQLAIPHLKKSKGNIVNVSSVNGLRSVRNLNS